MKRSSVRSRPIVVDASFAVAAVLPNPRQEAALRCFSDWYQEGRRLLAPSLWRAEAVSAIRLQVYSQTLTNEEGRHALEDLFDLGIEIVPTPPALCFQALEWAERLGQARAYDAFYLALAEHENATLWTADRRLANRAAQLALDWIHGLPGAPPGVSEGT